MRKKLIALALVVVAIAVAGTVWFVHRDHHPDTPSFPAAPALWNPCDALTSDSVSKMYGVLLTVTTEGADGPQCAVTPADAGQVAISANYNLVPGTLAELMKTFGHSELTKVFSPKVTGADDARLIVHIGPHLIALTGFVKNGNLVQSVNAVQPTPASRDHLITATTELLTALAAHAESSGITGK